MLSTDEWNRTNHIVSMAGGPFCTSALQSHLYAHFVRRTLQFHKVEEQFKPSWIMKGKASIGCLPCPGVTQSGIWKARHALERRGVISVVDSARSDNSWPIKIRFELPGVLRVLRDVSARMVSYDDGGAAAAMVMELETIREKAASFWKKHKWPIKRVEVDMAGLDENVGKARAASAAAIQKRNRKRSLVPAAAIKPSWIQDLMKGYCADLEIPYVEDLAGEKDRKMMLGSARNFLTYCLRDDLDPKTVLFDVCKWWSKMRDSKIVSQETGKQIVLPGAVSFMSFFRYRKEIMDWLAIPDNKVSKYGNVYIIHGKL